MSENLKIEKIINESINVEKIGLKLVGREYKTFLGRIDILAKDNDDQLIPIEIKLGMADDSSIGQILGYMQAIDAKCGIIMANDFSMRVKAVASKFGIRLIEYSFDVIISGKSIVYTNEELELKKRCGHSYIYQWIKDNITTDNPFKGSTSDLFNQIRLINPKQPYKTPEELGRDIGETKIELEPLGFKWYKKEDGNIYKIELMSENPIKH